MKDSENGFKETELGPLPEDWNVVKLGEVCEVIMGQSPPGKTYNTEGNGVPFLQGKAEFGDIYPTHIKYTTKPLKIALPNTVLISVRAPVGDVNLTNIIYCIGRGLASLSLKNSNNFYLFYCLAYLKPLLEKQGTGSTFMAINKSKLERFPIPLPPLSEQERIAGVLSAIQGVIEKTEKVIRANRELKRSLMKHLFTYGPVPVNNVDSVNLKDTEIGNIPQHWNVVKLGEVCEVIMGQSPPGKTYNTEGNGVPFLQGKAEFGDIYPTHIKYTTKPLKIALPNTVLISVRAPVGDVNLTNIIYCIGRGLASLSLKNSNNFYLFYCLAYLKPLLEKQGTGSTFMAINKSKLERFPIPLPPLSEQERIVEVLCAVDEKIQAEERKKKSLEVLFRSMLHYLMSGKIRVNNLNIEG
ncbi:MAG TPA: restriction endonuclease subunit S [Candidatus Hydrogenedens sp.]|nr:restriction endonuclease subunit S [Candidatus Hydrogenedens sp.]